MIINETNLQEIKLNELKLGYFGIVDSEVSALQKLFKSVERLRFPLIEEYDLCYMDISYVSRRVLNYIRNADLIPMIVRDYLVHPREKLAFLHEDSYLCLEADRDYTATEFVGLVKSYLERFREKKVDYLLFKAVADVKPYMKCGTQGEPVIPPVFHSEEDDGNRPRSVPVGNMSTRDVWEMWKSRH